MAKKETKKSTKKTVVEQPADMEAAKAQLIEQAKRDGKIEQKEITSVIPETPENAEVLDSIYTALAEANVDLIEPEVPAEPAVALSGEWAGEDGEESERLHQHNYWTFTILETLGVPLPSMAKSI